MISEVKFFEIRDRMTFIPAMATGFVPDYDSQESYLARRAGYAVGALVVYLTNINNGDTAYEIYDWRDRRTMFIAHKFIIENWDKLKSGAVIDVEYVLGEVSQPKKSERSI